MTETKDSTSTKFRVKLMKSLDMDILRQVAGSLCLT
jgi:hypothetical protein